MDFALSTNWNSTRHADGEAVIDEILPLGFKSVEIGYHFQAAQIEGLMRRIEDGTITANSVHAFTPVPLGAPSGHPELFLLGATEEDTRHLAIFHMRHTLDFAVKIGAKAVVSHAGRVPIGRMWARLALDLARDNTEHWRYRWNHKRMVKARCRKIGRHLDALRRSLDELLPLFAEAGVALALENLPSYDALPNPWEMETLAAEYPNSMLRYWHDIGHGQIMENAGFINHRETARRLLPITAGIHIHDVSGPLLDHQAPGEGGIDFSDYGFLAEAAIIHVFEPANTVTSEVLKSGLAHIQQAWAR